MRLENHDELKIGELPRLRIMPIGEILFHEEPDIERVAKLIDKFSADGVLKNPPVVAIVDKNPRRILLDGTNRITALRKLMVPDVLVQEIDLSDERLTISEWHHAIEHLTKNEILAQADGLAGTSRQELKEEGMLDDPDFLCRMIFTDGTAAGLFGTGDIFRKVDFLKRFTDLYHKLAYMDRVSYTDPAGLKENYPDFSALVSFRQFTKAEIVGLADAGKRMPSGITRVLLPKRALNFNLHMNVLKSELSAKEKNEWLKETVRQKILTKSIRFYREPTFSFDE
ncbi:MAG: hypothetical protein QME66_07760 [Candidatus Eisenbacteria bacterium]|nr:hypothetical protein [Candidatus Eisenbacteria bacterium]